MIGLVLGFAARQTLGNMVAGVLLAVTQPIRIGDRITFEDVTGRVDDLTLSYTYIDPGDGDLVVVPNEKLVGGVVYNHSTGDRRAPVTASAWVPSDADLEPARPRRSRPGAERIGAGRRLDPGRRRLEVKATPEGDRTGWATRRRRCASGRKGALQSAGLLGPSE